MSRRHPGSRHHKAISNRFWAGLRRQAFDRDGWRCQACGGAGALEAHHVVELAQGGTNDLGNLRTLCRGCHIAAHKRTQSAGQAQWERMVKEL